MTSLLPELEPVWKQFQETYDAIRQILGELPQDRLYWRPAPGATSAGVIVRHLANGNRRYAGMMESGEPGPRIPEVEYSREELLEWLERSEDRVKTVFEQATPELLKTARADDWSPLGPRVEGPLDALWFAHQMVRHSAYHLGQLNYISLLLDGAGPGG